MKHTLIRKPVALAALALCAAATGVHAGEAVEFENGWKLDWKATTTYQVGQRLNNQDPLLSTAAASSGNNDGNNNFKKGALVNNRVSALFETKLSKGDTGLVLSATTFYDDVYHGKTDNIRTVNKPGLASEFTDQAKRYHGGYSRFLDAYGYTSFDFGEESRANIRFGRHVVSWGESLFFPNISMAQAPFDGTKSAPGTETKDKILPEDQLSWAIELNPTTSLLGQVQFGFHPTIAPAPGSYLNTSDGVGPGGSCLGPYTTIPTIPGLFGGYSGCSFGKVGTDIRPRDTGQWGLGVRHRVTDETEVGLYYLNYNDRTPIPEINAFTPGTAIPAPLRPAFGGITQIGNGSYKIRYFDNIKLVGATASTTFGKVSAFTELTYKEGAPALVNTVVDPASGAVIPNPARANITQLNVGGFANIGRTPLADNMLFLAELSAVNVGKVEAIKAPGVSALGPFAAFFPASNKLSFGTSSSVAFASTLVLEYPGVFDGWDLSVPISYEHQINGRALVGGVGGEDDRRLSLGASFKYMGNLSLGVTLVNYLGSASQNLTTFRPLTDRDYVSFTAKYTF